ncbi:monofunctional biosynthetic peptidoglycan transglycosylase [Flavobacterium arcticum]|uniref:Biosynthetic peptidoglycan transglycosylase n=1 Tax=Flavobacterium arcticum TaxID=1784713 RepID=A0A345HAI4_9FLAO|nr:monofunctional biosynthetic peptidoglycan transglycosylase [Flavobacterium arcticum]AXG73594.1 monofunctional biosynthetic peptidoglycan transglycosylase [Flavobacterium arcticum]KAF2506427.1 monofunctional biosynthetic peptidoglycan transglycosylase [Flavobacterium arcticum]
MLRKVFRFVFKIFLWFIVISVLSVVLFRFVPVPFTPLMVSRALEQRERGEDMTANHNWVPIEEISPELQKAVIASEDGNFLTHHGFDFDAIYKAYKSNKKGKKIKGGSTISQQTAKNVFLWQGRSYLRKGLEAYFTVLIEVLWSKERIMEVYLNSIEMGDGIYGAQAAAKYWYHKDAKKLTRYEAAGIAAILPSPLKYKAVNSSVYINRRKGHIVRHMRYVKLDY